VRPRHSGQSAVERVEHSPCDVVLMDIKMPGVKPLDPSEALAPIGRVVRPGTGS